MIRKLRIRFIQLAMLSVLMVLLLMIGSINIVNYRHVVAKSDRVLTILEKNNGTFPKPDKQRAPSISEKKSSGSSSSSGKSASAPRYGETPFESRYFTAVITPEGKVTSVNTNNVISVSNSSARKYTIRARNEFQKSSAKRIFVDHYRCTSISVAGGTMYIFLDCSRILDSFHIFLRTSIGISLIGLALVFVMILFLSDWIIRPAVESYEKQKRFITDAGHEIRTPLSAIAADAAVIEMETGDENNEWLEDIKLQTKRLSGLTDELVYLARMEEINKDSGAVSEFDCAGLAREAAKSFEGRAVADGKEYRCFIADRLTMRGEKSAIQKLLNILLDNAFKYSDPGGQVRLTVEKCGRSICISVENTLSQNAQVTEEALSHLFDRFYRTDASRNSETGGHGIGLSIAQAIVQAHGGRIGASLNSLDSAAESGTSVEKQESRLFCITATIPTA